MSENIINLPQHQIIINGGYPLPGCPSSWEDAHEWQNNANEDKDEFREPIWKFDCGLKLDFDGPLISVSSRFYPPKTHNGDKWEGDVTICILTKEVCKKNFKCSSLDELKNKVEDFLTKEVVSKIKIEA